MVEHVAPSFVSLGRGDGGEGSCSKRASSEKCSSPMRALITSQVSRSRASAASSSLPHRCSGWWPELSSALLNVSLASKGETGMFRVASSFFVFEEIAGTQDGRDIVNTFVAQRNHVVEKN